MDDAHVRVTFEKAGGQLPLIAMDYAFTKTSGEHGETSDDYGATLVIVDADTMFPRSIPCEAKGDCGYTAASVVKFINSFFHGRVRLRSDGEGPIVALANAVKKERATG